MGWRDGMKFQAWLEEHIETLDPNQVEILRQAYEAGYEKGFEEGRSYDSLWDAD